MNEKALKTLEYFKIREELAKHAGSKRGREKCLSLLPCSDREIIEKTQEETAAALARIYKKGSLSFSGIPEFDGAVKLLEVGSSLLASELLKLSSILTATQHIKTYGEERVDKDEVNDCLTEMFAALTPLTLLNNEIQRCVLSEEEIADDASSELKRLRRQKKTVNDKIRDQLNSIMNSPETKGMLQDSLVTMRNGRYCLPVKQEFKGSFGGMIHDQSSKGTTIFMEPLSVLKLNNELSEIELLEQKEIERILANLSSQAAEHAEEIGINVKTITELDFIFARAALAKSMNASRPVFNDEGYINIKKGRHPLIDAKKVVPIDIYIGRDFTLLVITGPNTGGKTVSLKTVGLFTLMGQAGLHIPAFDGSELGIFEEVFADIGDEQSIEQSLSTFSSHMTNTVWILKECDRILAEGRKVLTLFDELGAGTDPVEGAALAMAILTHLHVPGSRCIATTHYSELKIFALTTKGVTNACCEFDVASLAPTYRLLIGIPGKSNAFAISGKLGLSDDVIDSAKRLIGKREQSMEDVMSELEARRVMLEKNEAELQEKLASVNKERRELKDRRDRLESQKDKILADAREEARNVLQEAKDFADESIRKYNKWGLSGSNADMERERNELRKRLDAQGSKSVVKENKHGNKKSLENVQVGDKVLVRALNQRGVVCTLPNAKGDLMVRMGAMTSQVNLKGLAPLDADMDDEEEIKKPDARSKSGSIKMSKALNVHADLNIIGKRVDEALPELDKYLDDAYLAGLQKVTIIHGRGTGALRDAVQAHLRKSKYVKSFRAGEFGEGDRGVTVVEFKESK